MICVRMSRNRDIDAIRAVMLIDVVDERFAGVGESTVDDDHRLLRRVGGQISVTKRNRVPLR